MKEVEGGRVRGGGWKGRGGVEEVRGEEKKLKGREAHTHTQKKQILLV